MVTGNTQKINRESSECIYGGNFRGETTAELGSVYGIILTAL